MIQHIHMFQHGLIQLLVGDSAPFVFSERMISLLQVLANLTSPPQKKTQKHRFVSWGFPFVMGVQGRIPPNSNPPNPRRR